MKRKRLPARVDHNSGKRVYLQIFRMIRDMSISGKLPG